MQLRASNLIAQKTSSRIPVQDNNSLFLEKGALMNLQDIIAATYGRVSDKSKQGDNFSVPTQLGKMGQWVGEQGWTLGYELAENASAYLEGLTRSELNKALDLARTGKIHILVFFSPDRFTRDMADGVILRRELKRLGVRLFCFWPTPHEITSDMEIMHILTDYQNQQFIERNKEASMRCLVGKVEMGLYSQGTPPYGYILEGKKKETVIIVIEDEAYWVRKIYHWYYYDEVSSSDIAERLNEMSAPLPKSTLGSREWTGRLVRHILRNETYGGVWYAFRWKKVGKRKFEQRPKNEWRAVPVPSLVSHALWEGVQQKLSSRHVGREAKGTYLLSSRILCKCGTAGRGSRVVSQYRPKNPPADFVPKSYQWYRCSSHERVKGFCGLPHFRAQAVDDVVWKFAYELIRDPEKLLKGYRDLQDHAAEEVDRLASQIDALTEQIETQKEELSELQEQRKRTQSKTVRLMLDDQIEALGLAIDEMDDRLISLQSEVLDQPYTDEHIEEAIKEIGELRKMYEALETINEEADFAAKRALINFLNLKVTLYIKDNGEKWIDIHWLRRVYPCVVSENARGTRQSHAISVAPISNAGG
jgi:site-specific DNA recombinase